MLALLTLFSFAVLTSTGCGAGHLRKSLEIVTLGQVTSSYAGSVHYLSPTFDAAVQRFVNENNLSSNLKHAHQPHRPKCLELCRAYCPVSLGEIVLNLGSESKPTSMCF